MKNSSSIREELDGSPMIITDDVCERENNEQVLEVISFDSHENERMMNMDHVLKSMTQISEKEKESKQPMISRNNDSFSLPLFPIKTKIAVNEMAAILGNTHQLKQELDGYKFYLLTALSEWEVQAINNFKAMKDRIDACLAAANEGRAREDPAKYLALQQEVAMLGRSLTLER